MNREVQILELTCEQNDVRTDKFVSENVPDLTRSMVQKLMEEGRILVSGKPVAKNHRLKAGNTLTVEIPAPQPLCIEAEEIPMNIVYEDEYLLVVNKPKGMVVHPAPGNYSGTLVNALLFHCKDSLSGIGGVIRPGIVHRIDKDTSGLLIVAKTDIAHQHLAAQIKEHSFTRIYEAVVYGTLKEETGTIDKPIGRHPQDRKKMAVTSIHSREAITHYQVIARYEGFTHVRLRLETGRTHQIRVHMASIGHPLAGDVVYGPKKVIKTLCGQCLHAKVIGFVHPISGEYMEFDSPLPEYFTSFLKTLSLKE